ncbi:MAG TPA: MFS transporter [Steroidobacteraceae bacterium]|jgi:AAA family ATP:ADP antiporter
MTQIHPQERRAVTLAFLCNFVLLGSYYILRPLRDTVATVFGVDNLQFLFTGTFVGTLIASPIYVLLASRFEPRRLLPGVFWFWLINVLLFEVLFRMAPDSRVLAFAYYVWFSVANLFMVSVFWTLMVDTFSAAQATRLFGLLAAGGSLGAIAGPLVTRMSAKAVGVNGLLFIAAAGFLVVIGIVHLLMREKQRLRTHGEDVQRSRLDHQLEGNAFDGFRELFRSRFSLLQSGFMLLMTWVNTVAYFFQTDLVTQAFSDLENRIMAIADIALVVNILAAAIAIFGIGRYVQRFGVTAGLVLNPLIMMVAFVAIAMSPTLLMMQALQVTRQASQFAIARPSREICFTVVEQSSRYKTKNVIDTLIYRLGDVVSAWMISGLRLLGVRVIGSAVTGFLFSALWAVVALMLGRRYEVLKAEQAAAREVVRDESPAAVTGA